MLKRKIDDFLINWKSKRENKTLIIDGARQIGKTFSVRNFGAAYQSFYELNFLERPELKQIFSDNLDSESILTGIKLYLPGVIFNEGNTLVFLDEIQECPEAITALKFMAADSRYDTIASGSALGIAYRQTASLPVGSTEYYDMHSLDLEEFLWALGVEQSLIKELKELFETRTEVPGAIHLRMMEMLRQYMVIGGMPEVVNSFIQNHDYSECDKIQRRIYRDYIADIALYASPDIKIKAENCYKSIPLQLSKENHKFQYKIVQHKGSARIFESSMEWLVRSHFVIPVNNVTRIEYPLKGFHIDNNLRLYPNDIGLLICTYDISIKQALLANNETVDTVSQNIIVRTAKGGIYEALAADILTKNNHEDLHFYRNEPGTVEIEFLIESSEGVVPIEVKAGRTGSRSLTTILKSDDISCGYKFASQNVGVDGKKITMPLYMLMFV